MACWDMSHLSFRAASSAIVTVERAISFLRQIHTLPLSALRLSRGKQLLIVALSYGLGVPGLWFFFPLVHNGASMLVPIISAGFLFRYRGLLITLVLNVVAI